MSTEAAVYESLGRKVLAHELLVCEYRRLLEVAGRIASGEVAADRLHVNLASLSWSLAPEEAKPCTQPET